MEEWIIFIKSIKKNFLKNFTLFALNIDLDFNMEFENIKENFKIICSDLKKNKYDEDEIIKKLINIYPLNVDIGKNKKNFIKDYIYYVFLDQYEQYLYEKKEIQNAFNKKDLCNLINFVKQKKQKLDHTIEKLTTLIYKEVVEKKTNMRINNPIIKNDIIYFDLVTKNGGDNNITDGIDFIKSNIKSILSEEENITLTKLLNDKKIFSHIYSQNILFKKDFKQRVYKTLESSFDGNDDITKKIIDLFAIYPIEIENSLKETAEIINDSSNPTLMFGKWIEKLFNESKNNKLPSYIEKILSQDFENTFGFTSKEIKAALLFELLNQNEELNKLNNSEINIIVNANDKLIKKKD